MEEWRVVQGYERYEVSNLGRIKKDGEIIEMHEIRPAYYRQVYLQREGGKGRTMPLHRIVATAFIPNPDNLPFINHKNENKHDNRVENLEWCTPKYNVTYGTAPRRRRLSYSKSFIKKCKTPIKDRAKRFFVGNEKSAYIRGGEEQKELITTYLNFRLGEVITSEMINDIYVTF